MGIIDALGCLNVPVNTGFIMTPDATDLTCRGRVNISTKSGSRGDFKVCEIVFPFITVEVIDSWINDYQDGDYIGDFTIHRVFNHTHVCRRTGGVRISFRAIFTNIAIYEGNPPLEPSVFNNQNHKLENENLNLKRQVESLDNQLIDLSAKHKELVSSLESSNESVKNHEEINSQLRIELDACQNKLFSVQQDLEEEVSKSNNLFELAEKGKVHAAKTEQKVEDLMRELAECKQQLLTQNAKSNSSKVEKPKANKQVTKSNLFNEAFGDYFGDDIQCVTQLPRKIELKLLDEDIVSDRQRLAAISKLLNNKTGAGYIYCPTSLTWEKEDV
ncbi:MAG: hypothetical protein CMK64_05060 [Pseudoalteromonas sp.]|nr:hypothetical protein [Pseudoalteromonas sp.]|tara:strand:- start:22124 stop:23113 length:990 start_codon:yes stop_codon:yes gene_type:complete